MTCLIFFGCTHISKREIVKIHEYIINNNRQFYEKDKENPGVIDNVNFEFLGENELKAKMYENGSHPTDFYAFYSGEDQTMYFPKSLDFSTLRGQTTVLHEYVHFLQDMYGLKKLMSCPAQVEKDAHLLGAKYLIDHGMSPNSELVKRERKQAISRSSCVSQDLEYKQACNGGYYRSCALLAQWKKKHGDFKAAEFYYKKSCEGGVMNSCNNLGVKHHNLGHLKSKQGDMKVAEFHYKQAGLYYEQACDRGSEKSCDNLDILKNYLGVFTGEQEEILEILERE